MLLAGRSEDGSADLSPHRVCVQTFERWMRTEVRAPSEAYEQRNALRSEESGAERVFRLDYRGPQAGRINGRLREEKGS